LAEKLIEEKNVVDLISAALAVVSGNADIKQRSILSSREVIIGQKILGFFGWNNTSENFSTA